MCHGRMYIPVTSWHVVYAHQRTLQVTTAAFPTHQRLAAIYNETGIRDAS